MATGSSNEHKYNGIDTICLKNGKMKQKNGTVQGDILAKLSVSPNELWNNKLDLYWEPGFKADVNCMDCFDNIVKWKADYTAEWIKNKLLERAHTYYEICKGKQPFWKRIWNRLLKGEELYLEQKMQF